MKEKFGITFAVCCALTLAACEQEPSQNTTRDSNATESSYSRNTTWEEWKSNVNESLDDMEEKLAAWKEEIKQQGAAAKQDTQQAINDLEAKMQEIRNDLRDAGSDARANLESSWKDIQSDFADLQDEFE